MDTKRIHKAATGRRASDINQRMNRRMKIYTGAIAVILAVLYVYGSDEPAPVVQRAAEPLGPVDIPTVSSTVPLSVVDRAELAGVRDGSAVERSQIEPDARRYLMRQAGRLVFGDLDKLGLQQGDWDELVLGDSARRGDAVWTLGTIAWWEGELIDGYKEIRGEVVDEAGHSWAFLAVTDPFNLDVGDVVKLAGFYFKAYELLRPDGSLVTAPLIVADEVLSSAFRIDPVTFLHPDALSSVRDYNLSQASRALDSPAFYELLSFVANADHDDVLPPDQLTEVMPSELLTAPDVWRGEPVSLVGVLYYKTEAALGPRGENPLGVPFVWQLWVADNRAGDAGTMLVICLEEPAQVEERQIVTIEGRFFRRFAFENKANRPRMAAVILARNITTFVPEEDTLTPVLMNIIVGMVGLIALGVVLGQWRERRALVVARKQRMRRHRDNIARPGTLTAPRQPSSDDPPGEPDDEPAEQGGEPASDPSVVEE
jgi:hypothetical protein